jgi:TolB protein
MRFSLITLLVLMKLFVSVASIAQTQELAPQSGQATLSTDKRIYISIGDPGVRKVLLAVEKTEGTTTVAKEFEATLQANLDFTDYFEILPESRMPPLRGDLASYKALGVEFLLTSKLTTNSQGQIEAEVRFFEVNRGLQILGRRYPFVGVSNQIGRELAHYAGNDIIQTLTGEPGVFRTQILMSCGQRNKEIFLMDYDGQNVRQLTQDRGLALSPSWSPDAKRILFTSYKPAVKGGFVNPNLYLYDTVTQSRRTLSAARGLNTGGVFHPKENKLAYTFSKDGRPEIYILDLDKNIRQAITRTVFFSIEPSWSPDGQRIVFSSSKTGRPHIWVANRDGSSAKRLTFAGQYNSSPNWSPRGDRIVFSGQENKRNNFNIFMVDPSGSNLVRLTDDSTSSENPSFSPDGRFVAFSSNKDGIYRIYVMTALGTKMRVLTPKALGPCKQPSWSPRL